MTATKSVLAAQRRVQREKGEQFKSFMTSSELAAYLGMSPRTFRRWQHKGAIPTPATRTSSGYGLWSPRQQLALMKKVSHTDD